eukprot:2329080-Amphidinium_carterae.1
MCSTSTPPHLRPLFRLVLHGQCCMSCHCTSCNNVLAMVVADDSLYRVLAKVLLCMLREAFVESQRSLARLQQIGRRTCMIAADIFVMNGQVATVQFVPRFSKRASYASCVKGVMILQSSCSMRQARVDITDTESLGRAISEHRLNKRLADAGERQLKACGDNCDLSLLFDGN